MVNSALICIAAHLLLGLVRAEANLFYQDPVDTIVGLNKWTDFSCTVNCNCTEHVGWYMAGNNKAIQNNESIPGLTIRTRHSNTSSSGQKTYFFGVLATEELNKSAIYCAVSSRCHECSASRRCYSRPALLIVRAATADTTALHTISSSRTPEITPSPLSYPTHTLRGNTTETASPAVVTLTTTVILKTTVTSPTNCPTPATASSSSGEVSSVSAGSARVTCAELAVLAGLVIASILF